MCHLSYKGGGLAVILVMIESVECGGFGLSVNQIRTQKAKCTSRIIKKMMHVGGVLSEEV